MSSNCNTTKLLPPHSVSLDALRAIAALSVLSFHFRAFTQVFNGVPFFANYAPLGMFGVDLFFVLSGFFICGAIIRAEQWSPRRFSIQRVRRIVPAYYFSVLILVLTGIFTAGAALNWNKLGLDVLEHLFFIHNLGERFRSTINGVYWTLGIEMSFYLLAMCCGPWLRQRNRRLWVLLVWLFVAVAWRYAIYAFGQSEGQRYLLSTQLPGCLDSFAAGGLIALGADYVRKVRALQHGAVHALLAFCAIAAVSFLCRYILRHTGDFWVALIPAVWWRLFLAFAFALLLLVCWAVRPGGWQEKLIRYTGLPFIGRISYSLYLYHLPVIFLFGWAVERFAWSPSQAMTFVWLVLGSFTAAILSYWFVERPFLLRRAHVLVENSSL